MIYKVGLCGASGKMGLEISSLIHSGFTLDGNSFELADAVADSSRLTSVDGVPIRNLSDFEREPVHVWIDFSRPEGTLELLRTIQTPVVVGTTGFSEIQMVLLKDYSVHHPVLLAPNMAPGMNALMKVLQEGFLSPRLGFEVVASETHHKQKKDSPSGTMKCLLSILEAQGYKNIQVQVTRAGEELGLHTLKFFSGDEEITLEHRVHNRAVFAKGALLGALFLLKKDQPGLYSYAEVVSHDVY